MVSSGFIGFAQSHWASIFMTPTYFQPANITVDGVRGSLDGWVAIYCSSGDVCGYVRQGTHSQLIRHDNPAASIGVIIYGSIGPKAYGYLGGLRMSGKLVNYIFYFVVVLAMHEKCIIHPIPHKTA